MRKLTASSRKPYRLPVDWREENRVNKGARKAKLIREKIEAMAPEFKLVPTNPRVENGYDPNADVSEDQKQLDYNVMRENKLIAIFDIVSSNYSYEKPPKPTGDFRVKYYKGEVIKESKVPSFIINELELEPSELEDKCFWIPGEEVLKWPHYTRYEGGKDQHNYYIDKNKWRRGLQTFIDELRKIV